MSEKRKRSSEDDDGEETHRQKNQKTVHEILGKIGT